MLRRTLRSLAVVLVAVASSGCCMNELSCCPPECCGDVGYDSCGGGCGLGSCSKSCGPSCGGGCAEQLQRSSYGCCDSGCQSDCCGAGLLDRWSRWHEGREHCGYANHGCGDFGDGCCGGSCGDAACGFNWCDLFGWGCGDVYLGDYHSHPPDCCDRCDCYANWIGRRTACELSPTSKPRVEEAEEPYYEPQQSEEEVEPPVDSAQRRRMRSVVR